MPESLDAIVDALGQRGTDGWQEALDLTAASPASAATLLEMAAGRLEHGVRLAEVLLARVPDADLPRIATAAVHGLAAGRDPDDSQAADLVALLSLQDPASLRPHLDTLGRLQPNARTYYAEWPWRGVDDATTTRLIHDLDDVRADVRTRSWERLLQARSERAWAAALGVADTIHADPWRTRSELAHVGIERTRGIGYRRLSLGRAHHLTFPEGFIEPFRWQGVAGPPEHPTWHLDTPIVGHARFGGSVEVACAICGDSLDRLVAIDVAPAPLPSPLELVTCLSCLGYSVGRMWFRHTAEGTIPTGPLPDPQAPDFPADPLPPTTVAIVATPDRWQLQDWALANPGESLHRLGGEPTWIQDADYPACPDCGSTMRHLLQLDSLDFADGSGWSWGSGGIAYVAWCDDCRISATTWQCT